MENAADALKIAFGIMMFVLALTLSISSFSQATQAVESIVTLRDRQTTYTYVKPSQNTNRIVGVETVIPTMYNAYKENFKIYFYKSYTNEENNEPLILYDYIDPNGKKTEVYYVDLEKEILPSAKEAIEHLTIILGKRPSDVNHKYYKQFRYNDGLYKELSKYKFEEKLGEYYQEDAEIGGVSETLEVNKTKKRIITYVIHSEI